MNARINMHMKNQSRLSRLERLHHVILRARGFGIGAPELATARPWIDKWIMYENSLLHELGRTKKVQNTRTFVMHGHFDKMIMNY